MTASAAGAVRGPDERGDTLIEILVAVAIIAIAFGGLLGALLTSTSSSVTNRGMTNVDAVLRSFAETARYEIQTQPEDGNSTGPLFEPCATSYSLISDPFPTSGPTTTQVVVFATGFAANSPLTVQVGSTTVVPLSGATTNSAGNSTILFKASTAAGAPVSGTVSVTGTPAGGSGSVTDYSQVPFTTSSTSPGTTASTFSDYLVSSSISAYDSSGSCPAATPTQQQVTLTLVDPESANAASGTLSFVVGDFSPTPVIVSSSSVSTTTDSPTSTVPATLAFTATVTTNTGEPETAPGSAIAWTVTTTGSGPTACSSTTTYASGNETCKITVGTGGQGSYSVKATYTNTSGSYPSGSSGESAATLGSAQPILVATAAESPATGLVFTAVAKGSAGSAVPSSGCGPPCFTWTILDSTSTTSTIVPCDSTSGPTDSTGPPPTSTATCTIASPVFGSTYTASVDYSGSGTYGADLYQLPTALPTLSVASSSSGTSLSYAVTIAGPTGDAVPTGTLQCSATPAPAGSITASALTTGASSATGTCSFTGTAGTSYAVTASYVPDSTSQATYTGVSGVVPAVGIAGSNAGDAITFTATISGATGDPAPSGTITCEVSPSPSGTVTVSPLTPNAGGTASTSTCSFAGTAATSYTATVAYSPSTSSSQSYSPSLPATSQPVKAP